jgi:hypothetical protein
MIDALKMNSARTITFSMIFIIAGFTLLGCQVGTGSDNKVHPRIIFLESAEQVLKEKLLTDDYLKVLNNLIINASDDMLKLNPVVYEKTGRRLLSVSRTCLKRVIYLSYSYRITGDRKYLVRAEKEMLAASSFADWNPDHFLDVAEMTLALSIGYDWLYDVLLPEIREKLEEAIINKGLLPSKIDKYNGWLEVIHNWNQVCNAGMSFGAWAVYEKDTTLANEIIRRAVESTKLPMRVYEPDGAYPEGSMYWTYGTSFHALFIDAFENIPGNTQALDIKPGFLNSGEYFLHVYGPNGSFNYADSRTGNSLSPAIFWYAAKLNNSNLLFHQKDLLDKINSGDLKISALGSSDRLLPLALIWLARCQNTEIKLPVAKSWSGGGLNPISMHRTSWNADAIFIGIKGGSPTVNHGHMDVGSFVMDANGVRWALDLGAHDYHTLEKNGINLWDKAQDGERWEILRYNNLAHNTLVINNKLQNVEGEGLIVRNSFEDKNQFTIVDISEVYENQLNSAIRGISIMNNSYVKIQDEIRNIRKPGHLRWAMLTIDSIKILNDRTAWIIKDNKRLKFQILNPKQTRIKTYSTRPSLEYEDENPGTVMIGFDYDMKPDEAIICTILLIPEGTAVQEKEGLGRLEDW